MNPLERFHQVWIVVFNASDVPGERPTPMDMVARELHSGQLIILDNARLLRCQSPPYDVDGESLFVGFRSYTD